MQVAEGRMLHVQTDVAISTRMARKRNKNGRVVEFPEGSDWKDVCKQARILAFDSEVSIGTVYLAALRKYIELVRSGQAEPPRPFKPPRKK